MLTKAAGSLTGHPDRTTAGPAPAPAPSAATDDTHYVVVAGSTTSGWTRYDAFARRLGMTPAATALYDPQEIDEAFTDLRAARSDGRDAVLVILAL